MDRSIRTRDRTVGQIKRINQFCGTIDQRTIVEELQIREQNCEKLYKDFNDVELELLAFDNYEPIIEKVEELYLATMSKLKAAINSRIQANKTEVQDLNVTLGQFIGQQQTLLQGINQTQNVRVPKINIEPFAGDYKVWPSFHDLFNTTVHENTTLSAVHKFQILNTYLRGDAAALIRHIKVTDQNYQEAWDKLVARYNKPKSIICTLVQLFLEQKQCKQANHRELRKLGDTSDEVIRGLRALGAQAESRDPWLIHMLVNKVDPDTKQLWATESVDEPFPTFDKFLKFLNTRCDALESCVVTSKPNGSIPKSLKSFHTSQINKASCIACKQDHLVYKCPVFKSLNVDNRKKIIQDSNSCSNCLRSGHTQQQCYSRALCLICRKRHHSLLHNDNQSTTVHTTTNQLTTNKQQSTNDQQSTNEQQSTNLHQLTYSQSTLLSPTINIKHRKNTTSLHEIETPLKTLLPTALIYIQDNNGQSMLARALLDSGSQSSFITESCIQRLGLRRAHSNVSIYGLASCSAGKTRGKTVITVKSRVIPHYTIQLTALIIDKISSALPMSKITIPKDNEIWQLALADPQFNVPKCVDLLIGAEFFLDILGEEKITLNKLPILHSTKFGWIIAGKVDLDETEAHNSLNYRIEVNSSINNDNLGELLKRFWEVEEPLTNIKREIKNDPCENLYRNTTTRTETGRFIVRLPFTQPRPELGDSFGAAKSRMFGIEKKFARSENYHHDYKAFMEEYIQLNQMIKIPWDDLPLENNHKYFMPHHGIYKESSTTKLRVVFDASSKTTTAVSLNDCLHKGPKLQPDLTTTLLRFRQNVIAINADIEKMYRQILVDPADANFQCILWRENSHERLNPYKCMTVTYGTTCAPFLAIRTLEELAQLYETKYPDAARIIREQFYMDDLLTGSATVADAITLQNQIMEILSSGGFKLRKWKSNSQTFLQSIAQNNTEDIPKLIEDDPTIKTLGIMWHPQRDIFTFKINIVALDVKWTKRKMLSESSKLYDPLGWLSPIIICFKMLLQRLWLTKVEWDEEIPNNILVSWTKIYYNLMHLQLIQIPRCLLPSSNTTSIQLHAFCDASESAYGCVVYIRTKSDTEEVICRIVCSKSKVAPIKRISLPRLELCGAVLLAELIKYCKTIFNIDIDNIYAWTDSMVVLHWLSDIPARWKPFIANRTSNILEIIPRDRWHHVSSKQNPADYISRGSDPKLISKLENWWHGPGWLKLNEATWPKTESQPPKEHVDVEISNKRVFAFLETEENEIINHLLTKYSSWFKIKKIMGYILRFCRLPKNQDKRVKHSLLTYSEYVAAECFLIRTIQATSFKREIAKLKRQLPLENNNVLLSLDPFLDSQGVLRVGGRLKNSQLSYAVKHPIILPKEHVVNRLIIQEVHISNLHAGITLMMNLLRQKYWIIGVRSLIKNYIKSCVTCIRHRGIQRTQKMADLPAERCIKNRPFLNTGVDYLGPIYVKMSQHKNSPLTKAYVAVFICLAVKAVHLEVVTSLNTDAFLAALKRFVSRRGLPNQIWCDNGSNFIGAHNELKRLKIEILDQQNHELISNFILQNGIEFKFNPASAPHFGGLWEAAVKSVKYHFRRTMKEARLNFEETTTLLTQIESILNSRPLCRLPVESTNLNMLTPGHFLIGEPLLAVPEPLLENVPLHKLSRWQNIQRRIQSFWKLWSRDYLNTLHERSKWKHGNHPIQIDDVVIIKEDNLPPNHWLLGRITQTHPGNDGIIRVATIKTSTSIIKRPVTKLISIPTKTESLP